MSIASIVSNGRRLISTTFLDSAIVADRTEVRDSSGGKVASWTDRSDAVACRFVGLSDDLPTVESGQQFGVPTAVWLAPLDVEAEEGDRVTNLVDGSKWIITSNLTPPSNLAISRRFGIREATKGEAG